MRRLWIERASDIAREYYLSITFDRGAKRPLLMLTTEGGVEIEQVAAERPEALARLHLDPLAGYHPWVARRLAFAASIPAAEHKQIASDPRGGLPLLPRRGRHARRDQPADRHARRASFARSTRR